MRMNGQLPHLVFIPRPSVCIGKWAMQPNQHASLDWAEQLYIVKTRSGIKPISMITKFVSLTVDCMATIYVTVS